MNYSYAYWFSRAEDELFLLMIMMIESKIDQLWRYYFDMEKWFVSIRRRRRRRKKSSRVLSFSQWSFHTHIHTHLPTIYPVLHAHVWSFYVCKCQVADPRRPSLCFSSRIEKKNKMRNMFSFFREQIQSSVPHVSSL